MRNSSRAGAKSKNLAGLMISAVLLTGSIAGCGKSEDPQTLVADAKRYQEKGDNSAAIIQLKNALQKNPDDPETRYLLGTIYRKTGDLQSAEKELRRALNLGIDPGRVVPDLGKTLLELGQFQQVLDETKSLSDTRTSAEILTLRGRASLALGKGEDARELFRRALEGSPDFSDALVGLAQYSLSKQDLDAATQYSEQAVNADPKNADAWLFKGDLLRAVGKVDPALAAYDQVVKLKPNNAQAFLNRAFIETSTEKFEGAKADIEAARKIAPGSPLVLYAQALLDFTQGNHAAAWESLQQILSKAPGHMPTVLLAGATQLAMGSLPQAEQYLKQYLEKDPRNLYARKLLATALLKNRDTQRALSLLTPALRDGVDQDPQLFALAGEAYMQAKEFSKATEYFEKAVRIAPKSAMLHTALSSSKMSQGDNARAIAELEMATKLDPKSSQAGILLVMTHLRLKEPEKALQAVTTLEKEHPDNPVVQNIKGGIYLSRNDPGNARSSFEKALSLQPTYFPAAANLAQLDLRDDKPDAAKKRFEAILAKDKKNIQAMAALSAIALNQGQTKEATSWLERAVQNNPDVLEPSLLLAGHYLRVGEKQKALTLGQKLQGANPSNPEVLDVLAQAQFANNDKAAALETYNRLAAIRPNSHLVQFRIAAIHTAAENFPAAGDALKKALALKPDYLDAQLAQMGLEARQGNTEKAIAISRQIQKQHQKSPVGYVAEGDLLMQQKNPALAAKAYEHAFAISKNQPLMLKLHASLSQAGRGKEANSRLIQWLKENPSDVPLRMYLGEVYLADGQTRSAIEQYQTVLQQNPKYMPAMNNLATAYQQEKNPLALEYAEKAYQIAPDNPAIMDTLGWILIEQGNTGRGLPLLQKAVSLAPDVGEIRYHFAAALAKSGDKAKARKELEALLSNGKNFPSREEARTLLKQMH
ncbi:putative PEP-CTERM system TPR-repeat lipoprotein [Nitrosospira sp. Nsp2]|uniref:XrtA/PEP-CTERM system TPR-repeat protein PrsT n=1 Tax=Nitrosospira sp. Nsp2 TaxID=136548 RepID=UPI000D311933|nr:XrtA/PEP-CTERM system TPR-repeat protein PrsT [Nitrosospira sp. Nsp2]PTR15112.1 putative PEP-CTERM system TPR-repeat lipoprotein [Nitrosospira sp. Nsp2]